MSSAGATLSTADSASGDELHLEDFLPYRLSRLSNAISGGIADTYASRHQLSVTEWRVIAILGRYRGISAREVAERGTLDKVAVSRAVGRLTDRGLLERQVDDSDRRRSVLRLSDSGRALYRHIAPAALAYEQRLLDCLDDNERQQLEQLLDRLWAQARILNDGS